MRKNEVSIGELNGWNSFWFKLSIRLIPALTLLVISWGIWITPQIILNTEARLRGPRFTPTDARDMELAIKEWHKQDIDRLRAELKGHP